MHSHRSQSNLACERGLGTARLQCFTGLLAGCQFALQLDDPGGLGIVFLTLGLFFLTGDSRRASFGQAGQYVQSSPTSIEDVTICLAMLAILLLVPIASVAAELMADAKAPTCEAPAAATIAPLLNAVTVLNWHENEPSG